MFEGIASSYYILMGICITFAYLCPQHGGWAVRAIII